MANKIYKEKRVKKSFTEICGIDGSDAESCNELNKVVTFKKEYFKFDINKKN